MGISRRSLVKAVGLGAGAVATTVAVPGALPAATASSLAVSARPATSLRATPYRVGQWLPSDQRVLNNWLAALIKTVDESPQPLRPVVQELKELIESDPQIYMYFHQMFEELPDSATYERTPTGSPQVRDYRQMLQLINHVLGTAPSFNETGLVGFPINAILDWPMGTTAGTNAFLDERVNERFKAILNEWGGSLNPPHLDTSSTMTPVMVGSAGMQRRRCPASPRPLNVNRHSRSTGSPRGTTSSLGPSAPVSDRSPAKGMTT